MVQDLVKYNKDSPPYQEEFSDALLSKRKEVRRLCCLEESLLDLVEELTGAIKGTAEEDQATFERGTRAISTLVRTFPVIQEKKEKLAREIDADVENARKHNAFPQAEPAEVESLVLESTRRLHAHLVHRNDTPVAATGKR